MDRLKGRRAWSKGEEFPRANLNTAVVDKRGIVWFTGQNGVYGRVDPKTSKVDAWASPRGPDRIVCACAKVSRS